MEHDNLAPILLFAYKRLGTLKQAITALQRNILAKESELYIFSDAARTVKDEPVISEVRDFLKTIDGFKKINIIEARENRGLANSIIGGVTQVINKCGKVIVLEDDLVTSSNFLLYMNKALCFYNQNHRIFSISGFSFPIKGLKVNDVYFSRRSTSWGWATWSDRWNDIDWDVKEYASFKSDNSKRKAFNQMGSDMAGMLDRQMNGEIDSWAIRWNFHLFLRQNYSVHPAVSKVQNIGFVNEATNTKDISTRYATKLDSSSNQDFLFTHDINILPKVIDQYVKHFSILARAKYKVINSMYHLYKKMSEHNKSSRYQLR